MRVAINGFGRIGRLVFRLAHVHEAIEIVAINDLVPAENLAYLLRYDSTHGRYDQPCSSLGEQICVGERTIPTLGERDPKKLPWGELGVDLVVESTGLYTSREKAASHLEAGAQRVIITAPAKDDLPTYVMGVNHQNFDPVKDKIVSNASCTTNCLAILCKVLVDHYGIEEGLMTTVHAVTASQPTVDGPSKKDLRGGRSALQNIIPASTGAAKAVALVLPQLAGKLTGMALRVPIADVSVVDLTVRLGKSTSYEALCATLAAAAQTSLKGFLHYCDESLVSSDFIGTTFSAIFDADAGIALNDRFFKLIAWYDNEMAYAARTVDLITYMESRI